MAAKTGSASTRSCRRWRRCWRIPPARKSPPRRSPRASRCRRRRSTATFSGKAQMFEGLIEFIEQTLFALINKITSEEKSGMRQIEAIIGVLLAFAQKNRGMTRVLIGDALVQRGRAAAGAHQPAARPPRGGAQAGAALRRDAEGDRRRRGRHRARQPAHELRHRPLAPVREERLQARPGGAVEQAVAPADGRRHRLRARNAAVRVGRRSYDG